MHGSDERNSDVFKGTERRKSAISARRGKKCSLVYTGPGLEKTFEMYPDVPEGKWSELAKEVTDVSLVHKHPNLR